MMQEVLSKNDHYSRSNLPQPGQQATSVVYDLVLMSELPSNDDNQAEAGKIYLSSEDGGKYIVRDISGNIQQGTLEGVDLTQFSQTISTPEFKKTILEITSKAGHTLLER